MQFLIILVVKELRLTDEQFNRTKVLTHVPALQIAIPNTELPQSVSEGLKALNYVCL